jgi:uncharacterized protein YcbX
VTYAPSVDDGTANRIGQVTQLWRYPVKSMAGEQIDEGDFGPRGLAGDRGWALRDEVRGGIRGAKKLPGLMELAARYLAEPNGQVGGVPAEITLPDGTTIRTDDPDASALVSKAIGHEVTLWPQLPADALEHYRRPPPDSPDIDAELRSIFALEPAEPLPDLSIFPAEIFEYSSPLGTYFDAFPLLLLTDQSLQSLQSRAPESQIDVRRFRPNLLIDAAGDGDFPEQEWVGRRVRVGGATFEVAAGCPRCVMTTLGFADLPADRRIMRTLVRETAQILGVYATVVEAGTVRVGDTVALDA